MTIFYYPTLLSFVASTLAYVIYPEWASSGVWTAVVIIIVYWLGMVLALRGGIGVIAKLASSGVLIGTLIPGALLVILGIVYLAQGNPSAAPMTRGPPAAGLDRDRQHRVDRQQLRRLLRDGDERRPRQPSSRTRASSSRRRCSWR